MPTKYPRISVPKDPELAAALEQAARLEQTPRSQARLLRELAIRGAAARLEDERRREELIEAFIEYTTTPGRIDREALESLHTLGWGEPDEP